MESAEFEKHERHEANHWWFEGRRRCIASVLETRLKPAAARTLLDVGCGTGGMFPMLARFGVVSGAEYSSDARERAQRRFPEVSISRCELPDDLPAGPYTVVTAFDVIEHVDDPVGALRSMSQRLAPDGQLVVTVPAFQFLWSQHDVSLHHRRRYSRELLVEHMTAAGLRVTFESYFNTALFPVVLAARLAGRVLPRPTTPHDTDLRPLPGPFNAALTRLFGSESKVLARGRLPVGVSLIAVGERA
jgi:2-polyprenyl-3-methyl-5-hydroxy-6-metoxy-1,4-benzoquinol methylase